MCLSCHEKVPVTVVTYSRLCECGAGAVWHVHAFTQGTDFREQEKQHDSQDLFGRQKGTADKSLKLRLKE